ncbi:hypothetical protein [Medusavirus stheno T3]|uniref:Uncharacterized protein n=1 Tax=Medusavirus stheno T3 TaxID=3069717 RepID=A0A7S7YES9_9VIRU|nr:hypothetical protein QKU73_gp304 [Acanthamoeba castellanii medusavirus]QPB44471.1 hypothetical protein [Medusavirus stheno T3]
MIADGMSSCVDHDAQFLLGRWVYTMSSSDVRSFATATTAYPAGAVLTFDATSPVCYSVQQVDHELVLNKGTNTHAQLDAFVASKAVASGLASLDGTGQVPAAQLGNAYAPPTTKGILTTGDGTTATTLTAGTNNQVLTADSTTVTGLAYKQVDHVNLANKGTNTHAQLDAFVASKSQAGGIAPLDGTSKVPPANIPSATTAAVGGVIGVTSAANTALGSGAFNATATGSRNVAVGGGALDAATTASDNIAIGSQALGSAATSGTNIAIGSNALALHTGTPAVAIGHNAMSKNVGQFNTALGYQALMNTVSSNSNTAVGYQALTAAVSTGNTTAVGTGAMEKATSGVNSAFGFRGLWNLTTGTTNTGLGVNAGQTVTTGSGNTFVGDGADTNSATGNDRIALGSNASATADGQMAIAPAITHIKATGLTAAADGTGTLLAVDASGNIRPTAGTTKTVSAIDTFVSSKGQPNGLATLDATSKVPNAQLPPPTATLPGALLGDTEQTQTILGMEAAPDLRGETVGTHNVAVGYQALNAAVGGATTYDNTAVGTFGLSYLTEGARNTGVGYDAGTGLTTGSVSTFIGNSAGTTKPDCVHAIALGSGAMADADGQLALSQYVTHVKGLGLTAAADGTGTLLAIDDATGIIRPTAGTNKTVAQLDTFIASKGAASGLATLDGAGKVPATQLPDPTLTLPGAMIGATASRQTILGSDAAKTMFGDGITYCTAIGTKALEAFPTDTVGLGSHTAAGESALLLLTAGQANTAIGAGAGNNLVSGSNNVFVGHLANSSATTCNNSIALGSQSSVDSDGQLALPPSITHVKATGLAAAADGTGTLLAIDASGYVRMAGGTTNTVAEIDAFVASKGQPNGLAPLDAGSKVPATNLPGATTAAIGAVTGVTSASTTALGVGAFNATATGSRNVALGTGPLSAATSATDNIAIGSQALASMASNASSIAIGSNALALHTGAACIAIGDSALSANTTGQYNTAVGDHALTATATMSGNTGYGYHALMAATSATNSTAIGAATLEKATAGTNTAVGYRSLFNATTGTNNTGVGFQSGNTVTTGARNTCIGDGADTNSATAADRIALGRNAVATADGQFALPAAITHLLMAGLGVHGTNAPIPLSIDSTGIVRKAPTPFFSSVSVSTDFTGSATNLTTFNNWDVKIHDTPSGFGSSFSTWTCPRDARVLVTFNFAFSCPAAINRYFQLAVTPVSNSNTPAPYVYNYGLDNYGGSYSFSASMQRALRQGDQLVWKWSMNGQQPVFQNTYTNWQISEIGPYPG